MTTVDFGMRGTGWYLYLEVLTNKLWFLLLGLILPWNEK